MMHLLTFEYCHRVFMHYKILHQCHSCDKVFTCLKIYNWTQDLIKINYLLGPISFYRICLLGNTSLGISVYERKKTLVMAAVQYFHNYSTILAMLTITALDPWTILPHFLFFFYIHIYIMSYEDLFILAKIPTMHKNQDGDRKYE